MSSPSKRRLIVGISGATGVAYARFLNLHQRHGDLLRIANLGDFCGTRWQTNVIMIPTPGGKSYLMPLGKVTALYRKHTGQKFERPLHVEPAAPAPQGRSRRLRRRSSGAGTGCAPPRTA